MLLYNIYI